MNKNIEVINEYLWAVNQEYVKMGMIQELVTLPGCSPELEDANLTNEGILILNKLSPVYDICKKMMIRIMQHTDEQLNHAYEKMNLIENPDSYESMYRGLIGWELKRRSVRQDFLNSNPEPTIWDKIINYVRKKVKKWHLYRQG